MKRNIRTLIRLTQICVITFILLVACKPTPSDIQERINSLQSHKSELETEVNELEKNVNTLHANIEELTSKAKEMGIYAEGRTPQYILKLKLKQSHMTLDLAEHAKDAMNAIEFEMPVDKKFYDEVSVGTEIVNDFRTGSFVINGSFGKWKMTVVGKEIR